MYIIEYWIKNKDGKSGWWKRDELMMPVPHAEAMRVLSYVIRWWPARLGET